MILLWLLEIFANSDHVISLTVTACYLRLSFQKCTSVFNSIVFFPTILNSLLFHWYHHLHHYSFNPRKTDTNMHDVQYPSIFHPSYCFPFASLTLQTCLCFASFPFFLSCTDNVETREIKEILFPANGSGRVLQSPRLGPTGGLRICFKDQGLLLRRRREFLSSVLLCP